MIKAVVDANVIISAVIAPLGSPRRVYDAWREGRFVLVTSPAIMEEVARKLLHPKIRQRYAVSDEEREGVLSLLRGQSEMTAGAAEVHPGSRDPDDDRVIAAALEAQADFVVTGDSDLLTLGTYRGIPIVSPAEFLQQLQAED